MTDIPAPSIQLFQANQMLQEHEVPADAELLAGRSPEADIVLPHRSVAAAHARIYSESGSVYLDDLSSEEGTFVDGRRVTGTVRLRHGQRILLGQHSVLGPVILRFEDPASRLLQELGLPDAADLRRERQAQQQQAQQRKAQQRKAEREALGPAGSTRGQGASGGGGAAGSQGADTHPGRAAGRRPTQVVTGRADHRRLLWMALGAAAALALVVWWLASILQPAPTFWRSVQLAPTVVSAGSDLVLQSPDIHPRETLEVVLGGEAAELLELGRGELAVRVPELAARSTGIYEVPLLVRRGGVEIYQRMVRYSVQPVIGEVVPVIPRVGELLEIRGSGFTEEAEQVSVRMGGFALQPEVAETGRLAVRVPAVTRLARVRVPLEVAIGDWIATLPELLEVDPRAEEPLDFRLSSTWAQDRSAWLIHHPFGPAFYVSGPPAVTASADGAEQPPARVQTVLDAWNRVFELADELPKMAIQADISGSRCALVARGGGLSPPVELVRWNRGELARLVGGEGAQLSSEMLCYRMVGVWNDFLDVFGRGQAIAWRSSLDGYVPVLNDLVRANLEGGGKGRPERREVAELDAAARTTLRRAMLPVPSRVATLSGVWLADLENIFFPRRNYKVALTLDLDQRESSLTGVSEIELQGDRMEWRVPPSRFAGELRLGSPSTVQFELQFNRPIGRLRLRGELRGEVIEGTFTTESGDAQGQWRAVRTPAKGEPAGAALPLGARTSP